MLAQARGDAIAGDGEASARWRGVAHFSKARDASPRHEVVAEGRQLVLFTLKSEFPGYRATIWLALPILARSIKDWCEA
jgi:hypothetical protein